MKKGVYFSIDALLAVIIIVSGFSLFSIFYINERDISTEYSAKDISDTIANIQIKNLQIPYVDQLIANDSVEANLTFIEFIGESWALDKINRITQSLDEFHSLHIPNEDFAVYVDNNLIYNTTDPLDKNIFAEKRMVSGISENRTRTGYIARAFASKTQKNTTHIEMGDVISSSVRRPYGYNNGNTVYISYPVIIPLNATINDASWFIEASWTTTIIRAYINDVYIPGSYSFGDVALSNLESYFQPGENTAKVRFNYGSGSYEGGDDGASHVVLEYVVDDFNTLPEFNYHNFAKVESHCSILYKKPVFAMSNISKMNISLDVTATDVDLTVNFQGQDYHIGQKSVSANHVEWNNSELVSALAANNIEYSDFTGEYFWIVLEVDDYNSRENYGNLRLLQNSSYVFTEMDTANIEYGYIDVTKTIEDYTAWNHQTSGFYRDINWNFNSSNSSIPLYVKSQFAWLYYTGTNPDQEALANSITLYDHPPQPLVHEFVRFGFGDEVINNGQNNFTLDFSSGYAVNPSNSFLYYTYLIPNMVPYGYTFDSALSAITDAETRLNNSLGPDINALNIETKSLGVGNVPSLWGPLLVEVRTW